MTVDFVDVSVLVCGVGFFLYIVVCSVPFWIWIVGI